MAVVVGCAIDKKKTIISVKMCENEHCWVKYGVYVKYRGVPKNNVNLNKIQPHLGYFWSNRVIASRRQV